MFPTFLAQFATGCFLIVGSSLIQTSGWKYLRLMAIVSTALALAAGVFIVREPDWLADPHLRPAAWLLGLGVAGGAVWLFVNAAQLERVRNRQRLPILAAGLCCLGAAVILGLRPDPILTGPASADGKIAVCPISQPLDAAALAGATLLGSLMLGGVTAAMLLGHRYLTDTDMPIAPLRRLAGIYLLVLILRIAWAAVFSLPLWRMGHAIQGEWLWFWLALAVRCGAGLGVTAVFGWMAWDCVRRRATQSATALFYLSMIFVFFGELAAQYLLRAEGLAL